VTRRPRDFGQERTTNILAATFYIAVVLNNVIARLRREM
jgi:hypothetical protein